MVIKMSKVVYLDQNVISDLRNRKILEMDKFKALKMNNLFDVLCSLDTKVIYSHVTLSEIYQINNAQYQQEHIDVLNCLQAVYIEPLSGAYSQQSVERVWQDYIAIMQDNVVNGCDGIEFANRTLIQKLHGLDVSVTFEEIYANISYELNKAVQQEQAFLESFDFSKLEPEAQHQYLKRMSDLNILKLKVSSFQVLEVPKEIHPDPQVFRQLPEVKRLELETAPVEEVVKRLESFISSQRGGSVFIDSFPNTKQGIISRAYSLMNWAGYHADDFQKSKMQFGDRLKASLNDMFHVASAVSADVILTEDKGMLRKAPACYSYMEKSIRVCSVGNFLSNL